MFETKKQLKEIINQLNSKIRELKDYSSSYSKLFMQATELNHDYYYLKEEKDELDKQNATLEIINCKLKSQLNELVDSRIKSSLRIVARCQKLSSENKALKEENEALKSKELKDTEKICDGVNSELLNLCTKLSDENMLLIHKQPIIRESEIEPKEKKEELIVKPTYFSMDEKHKCLDLCGIINDEARIGSLACQGCSSHIKSNIEEQWVKCSKRPEGKPQPNKEKRDKYGVVSKFEDNVCKLCIYKEDNIENNTVCDNCSNVNDFDEYYSSK